MAECVSLPHRIMNIQHGPSCASIMPDSHLSLWKYLYDVLPNKLIVAGSFASVQMRKNMHGSTCKYNDIDVWYEEDYENLLSADMLCSAASK